MTCNTCHSVLTVDQSDGEFIIDPADSNRVLLVTNNRDNRTFGSPVSTPIALARLSNVDGLTMAWTAPAGMNYVGDATFNGPEWVVPPPNAPVDLGVIYRGGDFTTGVGVRVAWRRDGADWWDFSSLADGSPRAPNEPFPALLSSYPAPPEFAPYPGPVVEGSSMYYVNQVACAGTGSDALTDEINQRQLTAAERDFTGLDCAAWMYDQRRPDEAYTDRGPHPYGAGVDRYRSREDLTPAERDALALQVPLQLLNAVNPHLYYIDGFTLPGEGDRWIASLGHQTTPFGYAIDLRVGVKRGNFGGVGRVRSHVWRKGWLPELEGTLYDVTLSDRVQLDPRIGVWLQPAELRWDADAVRPGGRLGTALSWRAAPALDLFIDVEGKTEGWVVGHVALGPDVSVRSGVVLQP